MAKDPVDGVVARDAVGPIEEGLEPVFAGVGEIFDHFEAFAAADHRDDGDGEDGVEAVFGASDDAGVFQVREMLGEGAAEPRGFPDGSRPHLKALDRKGIRRAGPGLAAYFAKHPTRLDYAGRLAAGRSIGSGAVEGAIKQNVNLRLKRSGARWKAAHVGPLIELRALSHEPEWQHL